MDYSGIYINLMERSFTRTIDGYTEKHHIVPRCMGGDDAPRNIAILTPEEHYLAHQLLIKIYPKNPKLAYSALLMSSAPNGRRLNNKLFGWIKRRNMGLKKSSETRAKMSLAQMGNTKSKGIKKSQIFRDNLKGNTRRLGIPHSIETKMKMSESISKARGNTTGYPGVRKVKNCINKFNARLSFNGKRINLGTFNTPQDAYSAIEIFKLDNNL